mmetsp:Transcript_20347/g.29503  ORF Transcript_20347/g.29503 Transcript_20347/m.29503 type:complete len:320 (+) Transcript_20347:119-1078(+)
MAKSMYSATEQSILEDHFRNAQWDNARSFLCTEEGRNEVNEGLTSFAPQHMNRFGIMKRGSVLITPALYAAIFHRAPFDIIEKVYNIKPEQLNESDMNCALGHLRNATLSSGRVWHAAERETILEFLVERCVHRFLLRASSIGVADGNIWTPLACAVENDLVSPRIVRMMCFKQPDAIDVKCRCPDNHHVFPLDISVGNREKRNLLLMGSDFYRQYKESAVGGVKWEKVLIPPVSKEAFELALNEAMNRKQWSLVNDLMSDAEVAGADKKMLNRAQKKLEQDEAAKASGLWHRRYLGPVMFFWDVAEDLISSTKRFLSK